MNPCRQVASYHKHEYRTFCTNLLKDKIFFITSFSHSFLFDNSKENVGVNWLVCIPFQGDLLVNSMLLFAGLRSQLRTTEPNVASNAFQMHEDGWHLQPVSYLSVCSRIVHTTLDHKYRRTENRADKQYL